VKISDRQSIRRLIAVGNLIKNWKSLGTGMSKARYRVWKFNGKSSIQGEY